MPATTVFLAFTGMSIFAWIVIFGLAITDSDNPVRVSGFYSYMTTAVGAFYTFGNILIQILVRFS